MIDPTYYSNLLIRQYFNKPKAKLTIELFTSLFVQMMQLDVEFIDAFNIEKAAGRQLDIIGEYVGQSRKMPVLLAKSHFAFCDVDGVQPDGTVGFSGAENLVFGKFLTPSDLKNATTEADDETFRFFIKLKIANNYSKHTVGGTSKVVHEFFGNDIVFFNNHDMSISYMLSLKNKNIVRIISHNKKLLPKAAGVLLLYVLNPTSNVLFSMPNADKPKLNSLMSGFSDATKLVEADFVDAKEFL